MSDTKTIRIDLAVWEIIEKEGRFGEKPSDVLLRLLTEKKNDKDVRNSQQ